MKFGFITTEGGTYFKEALEEAIYGEELGFDSVWLEEHHSIHNHYWPSPLMALAGIATRTERVLLGTDIVVLPFYHPVATAQYDQPCFLQDPKPHQKNGVNLFH